MELLDGWIPVFGEHDEKTKGQIRTCSTVGNVAGAALMADGHFGYAQPVGGVVAYFDTVSVSGVGYDIGCGVKAVKTDLTWTDLVKMPEAAHAIADCLAYDLSFGVGSRGRGEDHEIFDDPSWQDVKWYAENPAMKELARKQLGSIGSGNHYVDILVDEHGIVWVACHFGSRGFGHKTATGFLSLAQMQGWSMRPVAEDAHDKPVIIEKRNNEFLFEQYILAMKLAGKYAYAGRNLVIDQVLRILGAKAVYEVHNHHNYAWEETHGGEKVWVVRKGATPAAPGQVGFVGGSMGDIAVVVVGEDSEEAAKGFYSTVHGAGRVMSRSMAKGNRRGTRKGLVTRQMMSERTKEFGVVVRGGDVDESPHVYRPLANVLAAHSHTSRVLHTLHPRIVVMAGADVKDPYKD